MSPMMQLIEDYCEAICGLAITQPKSDDFSARD